MVWHPGYALDMVSPVRHVATELETAGLPPSLSDLAASYQHHNPGDVARVRKAEKLTSDYEAHLFMVEKAIEILDGGVEVVDGDRYRLAKPFEDLRYDDRPIARAFKEKRDDFNPLTNSPFVKNVRWTSRDDLSELRESMQAFGWIEEFPAYQDERKVVLVGHRRLKVAEELGIEPRIVTLPLGTGEGADSYRWKLAIASNIGARPLSKEDKKRIAEHLYSGGWTLTAIGEALQVSKQAISKTLGELSTELTIQHDKSRAESGASKRGRPRRARPSQDAPATQKAARRAREEGVPPTVAAREEGVSKDAVRQVVDQMDAREEGIEQGIALQAGKCEDPACHCACHA